MGGVEKPLLEISGKSMLQRIIEVLRVSTSIERIVVASSPNTPATTMKAKELGVENVVTPGDGFEEDMRFAIRQLSLVDVLVISSDLPFVTSDIIEQAVREYRISGSPALAVMARAELYEKLGSKPEYVFKIHGQNLVPVGINIIDGRHIDEGALDQVELVINSGDVALNVNTVNELWSARKKLGDVRGKV
jgi:adenosylcobinamide-phosphate guanylyltransferase